MKTVLILFISIFLICKSLGQDIPIITNITCDGGNYVINDEMRIAIQISNNQEIEKYKFDFKVYNDTDEIDTLVYEVIGIDNSINNNNTFQNSHYTSNLTDIYYNIKIPTLLNARDYQLKVILYDSINHKIADSTYLRFRVIKNRINDFSIGPANDYFYWSSSIHETYSHIEKGQVYLEYELRCDNILDNMPSVEIYGSNDSILDSRDVLLKVVPYGDNVTNGINAKYNIINKRTTQLFNIQLNSIEAIASNYFVFRIKDTKKYGDNNSDNDIFVVKRLWDANFFKLSELDNGDTLINEYKFVKKADELLIFHLDQSEVELELKMNQHFYVNSSRFYYTYGLPLSNDITYNSIRHEAGNSLYFSSSDTNTYVTIFAREFKFSVHKRKINESHNFQPIFSDFNCVDYFSKDAVIKVSSEIKNKGEVSGTVKLKVFLSEDSVINSSSDSVLFDGYRYLSEGISTIIQTIDFKLNSSQKAGNYYFICQILSNGIEKDRMIKRVNIHEPKTIDPEIRNLTISDFYIDKKQFIKVYFSNSIDPIYRYNNVFKYNLKFLVGPNPQNTKMTHLIGDKMFNSNERDFTGDFDLSSVPKKDLQYLHIVNSKGDILKSLQLSQSSIQYNLNIKDTLYIPLSKEVIIPGNYTDNYVRQDVVLNPKTKKAFYHAKVTNEKDTLEKFLSGSEFIKLEELSATNKGYRVSIKGYDETNKYHFEDVIKAKLRPTIIDSSLAFSFENYICAEFMNPKSNINGNFFKRLLYVAKNNSSDYQLIYESSGDNLGLVDSILLPDEFKNDSVLKYKCIIEPIKTAPIEFPQKTIINEIIIPGYLRNELPDIVLNASFDEEYRKIVYDEVLSEYDYNYFYFIRGVEQEGDSIKYNLVYNLSYYGKEKIDSIPMEIYLSENKSIDSSDIIIVDKTVEVTKGKLVVPIHTEQYLKYQHLILKVDPENEIYESNENNNIKVFNFYKDILFPVDIAKHSMDTIKNCNQLLFLSPDNQQKGDTFNIAIRAPKDKNVIINAQDITTGWRNELMHTTEGADYLYFNDSIFIQSGKTASLKYVSLRDIYTPIYSDITCKDTSQIVNADIRLGIKEGTKYYIRNNNDSIPITALIYNRGYNLFDTVMIDYYVNSFSDSNLKDSIFHQDTIFNVLQGNNSPQTLSTVYFKPSNFIADSIYKFNIALRFDTLKYKVFNKDYLTRSCEVCKPEKMPTPIIKYLEYENHIVHSAELVELKYLHSLDYDNTFFMLDNFSTKLYCEIYLSKDTILDNEDILLKSYNDYFSSGSNYYSDTTSSTLEIDYDLINQSDSVIIASYYCKATDTSFSDYFTFNTKKNSWQEIDYNEFSLTFLEEYNSLMFKNLGNTKINDFEYQQYILSIDTILDDNDFIIGTGSSPQIVSLDAGQTVFRNFSINNFGKIKSYPPGNYYFFYKDDVFNSIFEINKKNNNIFCKVYLTEDGYLLPDQATDNYTLNNIEFSYTTDSTANVMKLIMSTGGKSLFTKVYLSRDEKHDETDSLIFADWIAENKFEYQFNILNNKNNKYRLIGIIDADDYFMEQNETDNINISNELDISFTENSLSVIDNHNYKNKSLEFMVYPNPTKNGTINIIYPNGIKGEIQLEVFSINGTLIYNANSEVQNLPAELKLGQRGLFLLKIKSTDFNEIRKIISY